MIRLIRRETCRIGSGWLMLGILALMVFLGVIITGKSAPPDMLAGGYSLTDIYRRTGMIFTSAEEYQSWLQAARFYTIMGDTLLPLWIGAILAAFFIGEGFTDRTVNTPIFSGYSRCRVYTAKLICYFALAVFLSMASLFATLIIFDGGLSVMSAGTVLRHTLARMLCDIGIVSVPFLLAFIFRDLIKTVSVSAGYAILVTFMMNQPPGDNVISKILSYHPAMQLKDLISRGLSDPWVFNAVTVALFAAVTVLCYFLFRRTELK